MISTWTFKICKYNAVHRCNFNMKSTKRAILQDKGVTMQLITVSYKGLRKDDKSTENRKI